MIEFLEDDDQDMYHRSSEQTKIDFITTIAFSVSLILVAFGLFALISFGLIVEIRWMFGI